MSEGSPRDPNPAMIAVLSTVGLAVAIVAVGLVLLCGACGFGM